MKIISIILSLAYLALMAEEYDVISLTETSGAFPTDLSETGYVVGTSLEGGFIYHPEQGIKYFGKLFPQKVNDNGFVSGQYGISYYYSKVFIYDSKQDLLEVQDYEGRILGITDHKILARSYNGPATAYLYDLNSKETSEYDDTLLPCAMNAKGEMLFYRNGSVFYEELPLIHNLVGITEPIRIADPILSDTGFVGGILANIERQCIFIWHRDFGFSLYPIHGGKVVCVRGINHQGQITGSIEDPDFSCVAFIYDFHKGMTILKDQNQYQAEAYSINDKSQVVGTVDDFAFIWDEKKGMRALDDLIPKDSGWHLESAKKINNNGYIIGSGYYQDHQRPYLLVPKL